MAKRMLAALLLSGAVSMAMAAEPSADWRKSGTVEEKVGHLVEVLPSAANIMIEVGERYRNLYWAAKQGKWEYAIYQTEEREELVEKLMITRPKRAASAREFLAVYPAIVDAAKTRDWKKFEPAFDRLRCECMACHMKNEAGFVELPVPKRATSPVLNME